MNNKNRWSILPMWIKSFAWFFLILGLMTPLVFILGLLGVDFKMALYGVEAQTPFSKKGLILILLFILKSTVAFSLIEGKKVAIKLGIIDATIGILICLYLFLQPVLFSKAVHIKIHLRLELLVLIPYLSYLFKIKRKWEENIPLAETKINV